MRERTVSDEFAGVDIAGPDEVCIMLVCVRRWYEQNIYRISFILHLGSHKLWHLTVRY